MLTPTEPTLEPTSTPVTTRGDRALELELDLDFELESAFEQIQAGDLLDLSPEDLAG